ncbi:MAG: hypothetical protein R3B40_12270 [Polyangiales bacterium]
MSAGCSFRLGASGWVLGTRLSAGPVVAAAPAASALRARTLDFVGPDDRHVGAEPRVRFAAGEGRAVYTAAAGAFAFDGHEPVPLGPARHVALSVDGARARVVLADATGIVHGPWPSAAPAWGNDRAEGPRLERTSVTRGDVRALEAALSGDRLAVLYALPDPVLGVLFMAPGDSRDVRLRLPAPVAHVDVEWVGEQVGVALQLETGESMACVLDARGSTRVKPYAVLSQRRDGLTPRILWAERGFKVAVPCTSDDAVRVLPVGGSAEPEIVVEGASGPLDAVYFAQRYYFARVVESPDDATLQLRSVGVDGGGAQTLSCSVWPEGASARLRLRGLTERLRALAGELRGVDYRSSGADGAGVHVEGDTLHMRGPARDGGSAPWVTVRVRATPAADELEVSWGSGAPAEPLSFPRLRRWFRVERPPSASEAAQLDALRAAVPHSHTDVDLSAVGCCVVFTLTRAPSAAELAPLVRSLAS